MISPEDIVFHLQTFIPRFTNDFSEQIQGSASVLGNVVTVQASNHALQDGNNIIVRGSNFQNQLSDVTINADGSTRFITTFDHDLTEPRLAEDQRTLVLDGIAVPWEGAHIIDSVSNRRTFEILTPIGETIEPDITNAFLIESRSAGVGGLQQVDTTDISSFTFNLSPDFPTLPTGEIGDIEILKSVRVSGAADLARAEELYTQKSGINATKPYLFVIMLDADVSKDRHSLNDGVGTFTSQNTMKQTILQNFVVAAFIPTITDVSGFKAQDLAYNDYFTALVNVMFGFQFPDPETQQNYVTVSNGHGPAGDYNSSYYIHVYNWQTPSVITFDNGFNLQPDVAFRDITATWDINRDDMSQMSNNINLDDEAL